MTDEKWLPVNGWEGLYEVSSLSRVRSLPRTVTRKDGSISNRSGRVLSPERMKSGYLRVALCRDGGSRKTMVHRLVCEAFNGPAPEGKPLVLHNDGDNQNNHYTNLRWGDLSDNQRDAVKHGVHAQRKKTHCPSGHPYSGDNLYFNRGSGRRRCKTCVRAHKAKGKNN